jgi:transcriptional regulator with XRE-family HTH domain
MRPRLQAEIGRRLRDIRKIRGLTQKELAQRTEGTVDYSYIGKVERGEQLPSLKLLQRLGKALQVPVSYFFEEGKGRVRGPVLPELLKALTVLHREDVPLLLEILRVLGRRRQQVTKIQRRPLPARVAEAEGEYQRELQGLRERLEEVIHELHRPRLAARPELKEVLETVERAWRRLNDLEGQRGS